MTIIDKSIQINIGIGIIILICSIFLLKYRDSLSLQLEKWSWNVGEQIGPKFKWKHSLLIVESIGVSIIVLLVFLVIFLDSELLKVISMITFMVYSFFSGATIRFLETNKPSPFSLKKFVIKCIENCYLINRVALIINDINSFIFWVMIPLSFCKLILLFNNNVTGYIYIFTIAILLNLWVYLPNFKREKALKKKNRISAKKVLLYILATSWLSVEFFIKLSSTIKNTVNEKIDINLIILPILVGLFLIFDRLLKTIFDDYKLFKKQRFRFLNSESNKALFNNNRINNMGEIKIIKGKQEYMEHFSLMDQSMQSEYKKDKQKNALDYALDIRKFEIDLYWKRAAYFWAFIAASFAGYFAIITKTGDKEPFSVLIICSLGFLFSYGWYFVNRGSKFWQENWERHVDYLENEVIGPLYKTVRDPGECNLWNPLNEYPFSVSKINQLLSLIVTIIWTILAYKPMSKLLDVSCWQIICYEIVFVIVISVIFIKFGKGGIVNKKKQNKNTGKFIMRDFQ